MKIIKNFQLFWDCFKLKPTTSCESRNALASDLRYAKKGAIRERDPEMQLCAATATNIAVLCISVCNIVDMQMAIRSLREEGQNINLDDLKFFSPYAHEQHNLYGQFQFYSVPDTNQTSIEKAFAPL